MAGVARRSSLSLPAREAIAAIATVAPALLPCGAASSPRTTGPSTSRSARTRPVSAATKEHDRCGGHLVGPLLLSSAVPAPSRPALPPGRARLLERPARSAPSEPRSRCSPGWAVIPTTRSRGRSRDLGTSCNPASRRPSLRPPSSRSPRPPWPPASTAEETPTLSGVGAMEHASSRDEGAGELAAARGFEKSCEPEDGALLHVLAARRGILRAAEIGTGAGVGSAWIVSALPPARPSSRPRSILSWPPQWRRSSPTTRT